MSIIRVITILMVLLVVLSLGSLVQASISNNDIYTRVAYNTSDIIEGENVIPGQLIIKLKEGVLFDKSFLDKYKLELVEKLLKEDPENSNLVSEEIKSHGLDRTYLVKFSLKIKMGLMVNSGG